MSLNWLLTGLFLATGVWFTIGCVTARGADRVTNGGHALMSLAMVAMVKGVPVPVWLPVAVFTAITVWFAGLATMSDQLHGLRAVHDSLMGASMAWMVLPVGHQIMAAFAWYLLIVTIPLAGKPGHAAMSAGTGIMLLAM
ncbi:DUF5134 domain-containing protein [Kibdelosporangium philippinense]|uniref:DUF5134 domain-containing protein n=1 Tax=Kibdelosporangium philippinense TaxID=211113 RepID=A0ABS8Z421_9PSEU|nr:DUF5134 domain-containing protein [Kibdelosporangium philippinense]MCE7002674.1 DUF5134 domain-containing protein [Kibdelosporangium philippinense]